MEGILGQVPELAFGAVVTGPRLVARADEPIAGNCLEVHLGATGMDAVPFGQDTLSALDSGLGW